MQKRTFVTDTKPVSIDAPFPIKGLAIINESDADFIAVTDGGEEYPCPALVIATWSVSATARILAQLKTAPSNGGAVRIILTDEPTQNSTAQLQTLAGAGSGKVKVNHNGILVGTEPTIDIEDVASLSFTITDDVANSQIKITPNASGQNLQTLYDSGEIAAPQASFDITNIDQTYRDLIITAQLRVSTTEAVPKITFNGDTAANYLSVGVNASGTIVGIAGDNNVYKAYLTTLLYAPGPTREANFFGMGRFRVPFYHGSAEKMAFGSEVMGFNFSWQGSGGYWKNTAPITRITIATGAGDNFVVGSRVVIQAEK